MAGNPSYTVTGPQYETFTIENQLKKKWVFQATSAVPLLALIKDKDLKWQKGFTVKGNSALVPLVYGDIPNFNTATAGVSSANEVPTTWPSYDPTEGFTQARYEYTHMRRAMTIKDSEKRLTAGGERGDLYEGKISQLMAKFTTIMGQWISGNFRDQETSMMGIEYALNTANTVGGIDQSNPNNTWWQATVTSPGGGTLTLTFIDNGYDRLLRNADEKGSTEAPDALLLSFNGSGFNTFGKMRSLISTGERFFHNDFFVKYGIANFEYLGLKCIMENRMAAGTAAMLTSSTWLYGGFDEPQLHHVQPIPGSDAMEYVFTLWAFIGNDEIRRNERYTAITN